MEIGSNLKKLRTSKGMTQKDLADSLNVSSQAVSRWENNEVEPDISTLSKLSSIFEVPVDAIINGNFEKKETASEDVVAAASVATAISKAAETKSEEVVGVGSTPSNNVVASSSNNDPNKVIGTCTGCGKVLHKADKYYVDSRPSSTSKHRGHTYHHAGYTRYYCSECEVLRQKGKLNSKTGARNPKFGKKRMVFGLIFGIATLVTLMIVFLSVTNMPTAAAIFLPILLGYGVFAEIYCIFTDCYIFEVFGEIATWSVKFPGIIFSFSLDGLAFLIVMKVLFAILGVFIGIAVFLLAISISMLCSIFTFPFVVGREAI